MTDSPGFTFDPKTGDYVRGEIRFNPKTKELKRTGIVMTLKFRHACIVADITASPNGIGQSATMAERAELSVLEIQEEMHSLRKRLKRLSITIEGKQGRGFLMIENEMPPKWQPNIPSPVVLEGERP